jgi:hypothetical protein
MKIHFPESRIVGGFFEAEKPSNLAQDIFHPQAISVTSGRACLKQILKSTQAKRMYIPFYICDTVLAVIQEAGAEFKFYKLNEDLTPASLPELNADELFLYVNYFGLNSETAEALRVQYGQQFILDNTQAFFAKGNLETGNPNGWSFNSARKFFGVPDGAYLYAPVSLPATASQNKTLITEHLTQRTSKKLDQAYQLYLQNEELISTDWLDMSTYTRAVLEQIDYTEIQAVRQSNFSIYHQAFGTINKLALSSTALALKGKIPFCYPLWLDSPVDRTRLYEHTIFIPTLWKDVLNRSQPGFELEKSLSAQLLCLPLDHRYSESDCHYVIENIQNLLTPVLNTNRNLRTC